MAASSVSLSDLLSTQEQTILTQWVSKLRQEGLLQGGRIKESELETQCRTLLSRLREALQQGGADPRSTAFQGVRDHLSDISRARAVQGFSPSETATFIFSLKEPLFRAVREAGVSSEAAAQQSWAITTLIDALGLQAIEAFQTSREEVILRQHREIAELSTPVVKLWDGVLALPLIGTLDSERTQVVMENLLQSIVDNGSTWAIIDITGVPTVDTLTAQHLLKTVAAARLMGADCIISGIRPQIAQTLVHLGVDLNVVSKATLADAFATALRKLRLKVVPMRNANGEVQD